MKITLHQVQILEKWRVTNIQLSKTTPTNFLKSYFITIYICMTEKPRKLSHPTDAKHHNVTYKVTHPLIAHICDYLNLHST